MREGLLEVRQRRSRLHRGVGQGPRKYLTCQPVGRHRRQLEYLGRSSFSNEKKKRKKETTREIVDSKSTHVWMLQIG